MVIQNYQNFTAITSNIIYIVAFGIGLKCPCKIHLNTQWGGAENGDFSLRSVLKVIYGWSLTIMFSKGRKRGSFTTA